MSNQERFPSPPRSWRTIAHELTHEMNPRKVIALSEELTQALSQWRRGASSEGSSVRDTDVDPIKKSA
jgi:hypothetical protein